MKLPEFRLERYFAEHEFTAPHLLCCSDCETLSLGELLAKEEGALDRFLALRLGYTEAPGGESLRREISRLYRTIKPKGILVHAGAEEAIFSLMNVLLDPGDHVVVHWPCYQSLFQVAAGLGGRLDFWKADPDRAWALDLDDLKKVLRPDTKLVVVNSPHNPTGALVPAETLAGLDALSRERGFVVFSDEVYRLLEYDPETRPDSFCDLNESAVSLGVMSKSYGLAGLRLGWVASRNEALLEKMAGFKDYLTICSAGPSEFLAELALRRGAELVDRNLGIIRRNLADLDRFFEKYEDSFDWTRPGAGPIAFPGLKKGIDAEEFCRELVSRAGVLLLPGRVYDESLGDRFRIGFGRADFGEGLGRLEDFLNGLGG